MSAFILGYLYYSLFASGLGLHLYKFDSYYDYDAIDADYAWIDVEMESATLGMNYYYIAEYYGDETELDHLLRSYMYSIGTKLMDNFYTAVTYLRTFKRLTLEELAAADPKFEGLLIDYSATRALKSKVLQRNLESNSSSGPSMNIDKVWAKGYTGAGVTISILDDGIETTHVDLLASYNANISQDYASYSATPSHSSDSIGHGTWMAGVIGAESNNHCGTGIAFNSTIGASKILDTFYNSMRTSVNSQVRSLLKSLDVIDIYTCGIGPEDEGTGFSMINTPSRVETAALYKGVTEGRGGKGAIYVWATGNGGANFDDCNTDGFVNNVYTLGVNALKPDGEVDDDAEPCSAVIASVFASGVTTTDRHDGCKTDFAGSSAAAATASGIIALILEANTNLTWRDVQHIIIDSAIQVPSMVNTTTINGAGRKYSNYYGFGLMDAEAMLDAALSWTHVQPMLQYFGPLVTYDGVGEHGITTVSLSYEINDSPIANIENVVAYLQFRSLWREYTSVYLISPSNTESQLLRQRNYDYQFTDVVWYFSSLAFWGESANGTWRVEIRSTYFDNYMKIQQVELAISGTAEIPVEGETTYITREITDTDMPIIIGASIGAAVGFALLTISCVAILKATVQEITKNQIQKIDTLMEGDEIKNIKFQEDGKQHVDVTTCDMGIKIKKQ
ncbi:hypothetical protein ACF0H5_023170 [Mactra antiquata]